MSTVHKHAWKKKQNKTEGDMKQEEYKNKSGTDWIFLSSEE